MNAFEPVYAYVRTIPRGRVLSYGEVGQAVGVTARTVGWALSGCPDDVPWHRVVGADGGLRTARRSPEIYALQKQRLAEEGIALDAQGRVDVVWFWTYEERL
jgi:methylated-DNA-protein-cysteine methyltransferase-like protein